MSEYAFPTKLEKEPDGFLQLYNATTGEIIPASPAELLRLESQDIDHNLMVRLVGIPETIGGIKAVLISDRPGFIAATIAYNIYPQRFEGRLTEPPADRDIGIGWSKLGIADNPGFNVELIIKDIGEQLHPDLEALIRQHVYYREGENPEIDDNAMWRLTMLEPDEIRRNLITLSDIEPKDILGLGPQPTLIEALMAIAFFCGEASLDGKEDEVLSRILPDEEHSRVMMQLEALGPQFGEEFDFDAELQGLHDSEEQ